MIVLENTVYHMGEAAGQRAQLIQLKLTKCSVSISLCETSPVWPSH